MPRAAVGGSGRGPGGEKGGFAASVAAELAAEAEKLIGADAAGGIDFEAVETAARRVALDVMGKVLAARLNAQRCNATGSRRRCECAGQARYVGRRRKSFVTALGEMELERAWYHCDACHRGFSPRDRALGFDGGSLSPAVRRMAGLAGAETSFARASTMLRELAGLKVGAKQVERYVETLGRDIARDEREVVEHEPSPARTLYVGLDGTGVPVRKSETADRIGKQPDGTAKTREVKLVTVWSAERRDRQGAPCRDAASVSCNGAIESIASRDVDRVPSAFAARILRELQRRGFAQAERRVVLGDGAAWIWNFADEHLPGAIQIVDLFHAKQHIFDVAKALYGPGSDLAAQWGKARRDELDRLGPAPVIDALRAQAGTFDEARKGLDYFTANRQRMVYPKFRALGLCVTTGVVEGACKSVIGNRLKRGGMHWSVDGANAIIALRCAIESNRFDDYWERQAVTS